MRNNHDKKTHKLGKRTFALCLALAVICSCLLPVFATGNSDTAVMLPEDGGIAMPVAGDDSGAVVQPGGEIAMPVIPGDGEGTASSGSESGSTPVTDPSSVKGVTFPEGATNIVKNPNGSYSYDTAYGRVTVFPDADKVDMGDGTVKPNPNLKDDDAAFGVLPITYHFWLKKMDSFDLDDLTWEAEMAELSETEYLSLYGSSKKFPIWHMDTISADDVMGNYTFNNPTSLNDPEGKGREFAGWYTVDSLGVESEFEFYKSYGDESNTTINVFAKWKDASGDVVEEPKTDDTKSEETKDETKQEEIKADDTKKNETAKAALTAEATLPDTDAKATVTVEGMPASATHLTVIHMGTTSMKTFYSVYTDQGGKMDAFMGFKIAPKDANGNVVQPNGPVTVTITGLGELGLDALPNVKVLHQKADNTIETLDATYNNGVLTFQTTSFSPFVIAYSEGNKAVTLEQRTVSIKAGSSSKVDVSNIQRNSVSCECGQTGITAAYTSSSGWGSSAGYTISVASNVPDGKYTLTVHYSTSWGGSQTDTVTVQVYTKDATINNELEHTIVQYAYYKDGAWNWSKVYKDGEGFTVSYNKTGDATYYVFFVKPEENYLLTTFEIESQGFSNGHDLYAVDKWNTSKISNFTDLSDLVATAKSKGYEYVGMLGYTTSAVQTSGTVLTQKFRAIKPTLEVKATTDAKKVKPGDKVTFNVTLTPEKITDSTITKVEAKSLTINGKEYQVSSWTKQDDGTYTATIDYDVTIDDWRNENIQLNVTADVTYNYTLSVKDTSNAQSQIKSTSVVENTASATVSLDVQQGVAYEVSYDPADKATNVQFPAVPVDTKVYFNGDTVTVKGYNMEPITDLVNGGQWTFTGWKIAGDDSGKVYTSGKTLTMGNQKILFQGVWKFEKTYCNVSITKQVKGLLGDHKGDFTFSVTFDRDASNVVATRTNQSGESPVNLSSFTLKSGESIVLSNVPIGAVMTVTEVKPGSQYKVTATEYNTAQSGADDAVFTYKIIANSDTASAAVVSYTAEAGYTTGKSVTNNAITVTNDAPLIPDTGVILDTLPYIVILAVVVGGGVMLFLRKRRKDDED